MKDFYTIAPAEQAARLQGLAQKALAEWDLGDDATVELIKHRENAVFCIDDGGKRFAMRVHRANYHTDAELASELQWIAAINCDEVKTPQCIPTRRGELFARVEADGVPEARQVDLLEWFDGEPIASIEAGFSDSGEVASIFGLIGKLMASLHNHSEAWTLPPGFVRHSWDEAGLLGDEPFWGRFWELAALTRAQKQRLLAVREKAIPALRSFGKSKGRFGLIHADFLPENLLKQGDQICLIDFDDSGFGWHMFDIATTMFFHIGEVYINDAFAGFVDGYRKKRALPDADLEWFEFFLLMRGLTYLGWAHTRSETETAQELAPVIIAAVDEMASEFLQR